MKFVNLFVLCYTVLSQFRFIVTDLDDNRCPPLKIDNGRVKLRSKGRSAKFRCDPTYQLFGNRTATCIERTWDAAPPLCIKNNCPRVSRNPKNGYWIDDYRGAMITLICDTGYAISGTPKIYCHRGRWSAAVPVCRAVAMEYQTTCDFESEDLCGWTHDVHQNFNWSRQNFTTPSNHVGTGPSFDHTKGQGHGGHYMYIESSSPRMENDTARLFSPRYAAQLSRDACFIFWYHMYGATTGTLYIYIKPESTNITNLTPIFQRSGEQGNQWLMGVIRILPVEEPFQIVIEAIRGTSYGSDTAIDDVKLTKGAECVNITKQTIIATSQKMVTSFPATKEMKTVTAKTVRPYTTRQPSPTSFPLSTSLPMKTSLAPHTIHTTQISIHKSTAHKSSTETFSYSDLLSSSNNINSVDTQFSQQTDEIITSTSSSLSSVSWSNQPINTFNTLPTDVSSHSSDYTESSLYDNHHANNQLSTLSTNSTKKHTPVQSTLHTITTPSINTKKNTFKVFYSSTPKTQLKSSTNRTKEQRKRTTLAPSTVFKESSNTIKKPLHLIGITGVAAGGAAISIIAAVLIFTLARRRMRLKSRNEMSEDSDVRYLTSDEILDFTLARPADDEL